MFGDEKPAFSSDKMYWSGFWLGEMAGFSNEKKSKARVWPNTRVFGARFFGLFAGFSKAAKASKGKLLELFRFRNLFGPKTHFFDEFLRSCKLSTTAERG